MKVISTIVIALLMMSRYAVAAPLACLIEPEKVAEIGSQGIGVIQKINVERGDVVEAGQLLASLQSDVERASVSVATARSQAEADLKAALTARELTQRKLTRARELFDKKFISQEAVDQAEAEARISENRVAQAREVQRVSQQELAVSNLQLAQRSIRSPFAGVVLERYRTEGERIEREPILRLAKVDPLRVEVIMPAAQFGQIKAGSPVTLSTDLPGMKDLHANVALIDRTIDAASNTFRVRLTLPNPDRRIPAGLRCKADFGAVPVKSSAPGASSSMQGRMVKVSTIVIPAPVSVPIAEDIGPGIQLKLAKPVINNTGRAVKQK